MHESEVCVQSRLPLVMSVVILSSDVDFVVIVTPSSLVVNFHVHVHVLAVSPLGNLLVLLQSEGCLVLGLQDGSNRVSRVEVSCQRALVLVSRLVRLGLLLEKFIKGRAFMLSLFFFSLIE